MCRHVLRCWPEWPVRWWRCQWWWCFRVSHVAAKPTNQFCRSQSHQGVVSQSESVAPHPTSTIARSHTRCLARQCRIVGRSGSQSGRHGRWQGAQ
uniref:Putative secreted protein n=1 Tax=Anopheles marajoara TaxID=58244 RepID=A0A2M4C9J7_9DIPT